LYSDIKLRAKNLQLRKLNEELTNENIQLKQEIKLLSTSSAVATNNISLKGMEGAHMIMEIENERAMNIHLRSELDICRFYHNLTLDVRQSKTEFDGNHHFSIKL